jgi:protease-4
MEIVNESIFVSAIRSFCKVFFSCIGLFLAFFVGSLVYSIFSSPFAPIDKTTLNILPNLDSQIGLASYTAPVILRINIDGVIGTPGMLDSGTIENILLESRSGLLDKNRVKAILLHLNTPGGGAVDSDNIYRMLKEYKARYQVPIYAYIDGFCASGGMLISSAADKMYASPPSIVGSVGVIWGPFFNFSEVMEKIGVQSKTLTEGIDKDTMSPARPWKANEGADLDTIMASSYARFVDIVTQARPRLDKEKLVNVYGAQVFDGQTALKYGYIDVADAEMKTVLTDLMTAANIDVQKPYQIVELVPKGHWLSPLSNQFGLLKGKMEHSVNLKDKQRNFLYEPVSYYYDTSPTAIIK